MRVRFARAVVLAAAAAMVLVAVAAPVDAAKSTKTRADVVAVDAGGATGWSQLHRAPKELRATVHTSGLVPGGAYTDLVGRARRRTRRAYVQHLAGFVVGANGKHTTHASAAMGDPGLDISPLIPTPGPINVGPLTKALINDAPVEFHVIYHGQADQAANGTELDLWLSNFWSGDPAVCNHMETFPFGDRQVCELEQISVH